MNQENKSLDILGIKPIGNAIESLTDGFVSGASAFLSRICLPAAEEFGLLLRDRVGMWRANNATSIANRAERLLATGAEESLHAHPRIVANVIELGSWSDAEEVQEMWAGLLASACTPDGRDDSNLMFIDLLSKLTTSQARLFDFICTNCKKTVAPAGWILSEDFSLSLDDLESITRHSDFHRIDLELDHLRTLGLLNDVQGGFNPFSTEAAMAPSALALQMFVRCRGSKVDPITYYDAKPPTPPESTPKVENKKDAELT